MVKYTLVMDLAKQFSTRLSKDRLINTVLMGDGRYFLNQYDPSKVYHIGDKIPYLTDTGELVILTALEDNITGPLDLRKWEEWDIVSETIRLYQDFIQLSWHVPKSRLNRVWLSIKKESMQDYEDLDINVDGILVYSNFIISKDRPTMTKNVIWGRVTELVAGDGTTEPGGSDEYSPRGNTKPNIYIPEANEVNRATITVSGFDIKDGLHVTYHDETNSYIDHINLDYGKSLVSVTMKPIDIAPAENDMLVVKVAPYNGSEPKVVGVYAVDKRHDGTTPVTVTFLADTRLGANYTITFEKASAYGFGSGLSLHIDTLKNHDDLKICLFKNNLKTGEPTPIADLIVDEAGRNRFKELYEAKYANGGKVPLVMGSRPEHLVNTGRHTGVTVVTDPNAWYRWFTSFTAVHASVLTPYSISPLTFNNVGNVNKAYITKRDSEEHVTDMTFKFDSRQQLVSIPTKGKERDVDGGTVHIDIDVPSV